MVHTDSLRGRAALLVANCAGMVDLVALPVWVGTLVGHYRFDAQQAGAIVTLFLAGAVSAGALLAPRFAQLPRRRTAVIGFALAALAFLAASGQQDFAGMAALHLAAGAGVGAALGVTHGSIARSTHPHRLFAMAGTALGVFAVAFFAIVPPVLASAGGSALFAAFAAVMGLAAVVSLLAFPQADAAASPAGAAARARPSPIPHRVWFGVAGIGCMALVQAMTFAFLERVGTSRGFDSAAIAGVLVALSIVNLFPAPLAALLERRLPARQVMVAGPVLQALLVAVIMQSALFAPYAGAGAVFAAVIMFTHTFAFGELARLEPSGRALAAAPAMMMTGAAIGPVLGGTLVKHFGYGSLAFAAAAIAGAAIVCFMRLPPQPPARRQEATA